MPPEDALSPWSPLSILVHRPPASLRCLPHTFALLPGQLGSHCAPRGNRNLWNRTMWRPNTHLGSQAHLHTPSSPPLHLPFPGPGASFLNPGAPPWLVPSPLLQHPFFPSIISPSFPKAFSYQSRNICRFAPLKRRRRAREGGKKRRRRGGGEGKRKMQEKEGEDRKSRNNKHWADAIFQPVSEVSLISSLHRN